jgi:hypothetical protein
MPVRDNCPYTGPNFEPTAKLIQRVAAPERLDDLGALPSARMTRMSFPRQSMVVALALVLVVSLPIVSAQASSIHHHTDNPVGGLGGAECSIHHHTGNLVGGLEAAEFTVAPTSPGNFGIGAEVTWSLMPTNQDPGSVFNFFHEGGISHLSTFMGGQWKAEIDRAFAAWSDVANITFTEVNDDNASVNAFTTGGDIRIGGAVFDGPGNLLGHGWFPNSASGGSLESDIHFDIAENWTIGFAGPGFDIFTVAAHEIGHAIGLDHSTVPGSLMNPSYTEAFSGLQADDILGAQFIYGIAPVSFSIVVLPEPDTFVLLTTGLIGFAAGRKKRTVTT